MTGEKIVGKLIAAPADVAMKYLPKYQGKFVAKALNPAELREAAKKAFEKLTVDTATFSKTFKANIPSKAERFERAVTRPQVIDPMDLVGRPAEELYDKASYMIKPEFWIGRNGMRARIGDKIAELTEKRNAMFSYIRRNKDGQFAGGLLKPGHSEQYQAIKEQLAKLKSLLNHAVVD